MFLVLALFSNLFAVEHSKSQINLNSPHVNLMKVLNIEGETSKALQRKNKEKYPVTIIDWHNEKHGKNVFDIVHQIAQSNNYKTINTQKEKSWIESAKTLKNSILNMSFGSRFFNKATAARFNQYKDLLKNGNVLVIAAGNEGLDFELGQKGYSDFYFEAYARELETFLDGLNAEEKLRILFVGSTTRDGSQIANYSNVALSQTLQNHFVFSPPGIPNGTTNIKNALGTSYSAPVMSGLISLIANRFNLTLSEACEVVLKSTQKKKLQRKKGALDTSGEGTDSYKDIAQLLVNRKDKKNIGDWDQKMFAYFQEKEKYIFNEMRQVLSGKQYDFCDWNWPPKKEISDQEVFYRFLNVIRQNPETFEKLLGHDFVYFHAPTFYEKKSINVVNFDRAFELAQIAEKNKGIIIHANQIVEKKNNLQQTIHKALTDCVEKTLDYNCLTQGHLGKEEDLQKKILRVQNLQTSIVDIMAEYFQKTEPIQDLDSFIAEPVSRITKILDNIGEKDLQTFKDAFKQATKDIIKQSKK